MTTVKHASPLAFTPVDTPRIAPDGGAYQDLTRTIGEFFEEVLKAITKLLQAFLEQQQKQNPVTMRRNKAVYETNVQAAKDNATADTYRAVGGMVGGILGMAGAGVGLGAGLKAASGAGNARAAAWSHAAGTLGAGAGEMFKGTMELVATKYSSKAALAQADASFQQEAIRQQSDTNKNNDGKIAEVMQQYSKTNDDLLAQQRERNAANAIKT